VTPVDDKQRNLLRYMFKKLKQVFSSVIRRRHDVPWSGSSEGPEVAVILSPRQAGTSTSTGTGTTVLATISCTSPSTSCVICRG
jgi:hypothetical protein